MTQIKIGLGLFLIGLTFKYPPVNHYDIETSIRIHTFFKNKPYLHLFRFLWPLGTTPIILILLIVITLFDLRTGLITLTILLGSIIFETRMKRFLARGRPFNSIKKIKMTQPKRPNDPSFPSGDALRIWFIALVIPIVFNLGVLLSILLILVATVVSLGRIVLGVHYTLDVISGTGLGVLSSGIWALICC